jgi:hypothetical protein
MVELNKSTIIEDIWKNFYNSLNGNYSSINFGDGIIKTVNSISSNYPDKVFTSESSYPIVIINSPSFDSNFFSYGKRVCDGSITIEMYTLQAKTADMLLSQTLNLIETNKNSLSEVQLYNVEVQDIDNDMYERGGLKVHYRRVIFTFNFIYGRHGY